jgi:NAD+ synthase
VPGPPVGSPQEWRLLITRFMADHVAQAHAKGVVVGLSGGLDSAVVAALAAEALGKDAVLGLILPSADSDPADATDAALLAKHVGFATRTISIAPVLEGLSGVPEISDARVRGNAKARARMMVLYASAEGRLVAGTGNKSELLVGYFTKHGDGGVDLLPIGDLYKTQVFELARHMGLPQRIIDRPPSAGLWPGQTDEKELGMPYADLDRILKGIELNAQPADIARRTGLPLSEVDRVGRMVRATEHKRHTPLVPKVGARTVGIDWRRSVHWSGG